MSEFTEALKQLPPTLREEVAVQWQDFCTAAEQTTLTVVSDSPFLEQLVRVWVGSDFVVRACRRDPAMLADLVNTGALTTTREDYRTRLDVTAVANETQLGVILRQFRRREMVRIAWRDLAGLAGLQETLVELSDLADTLIQAALEKLYTWQCQRFGVPRNTEGQAQQLVVLGMGKLGGRELNFSSDIDLIFAFPHKGETDGRRRVDNETFFRRLGQSLIRVLEQPTAEGFVYRVDMRLRPFGEAGPLVIPFSAIEDYYQRHGREWERYAMIKARVVAGDQASGEDLLLTLRPFVYRRYLDYGAFESLRDMKTLIAKEVERKGLRRNVKLGPGGIREIEFIAQAFQLIYGGREPALRERSVLRVLDHLAQSERLPIAAVQGLQQAYVFLRRTENRLQAWADQQTHNLPQDETAKLRLAYSMGFAGWADFVAALMRHVEFVSEQFQQVFAEPGAETHSQLSDCSALWHKTIGAETAIRWLEQQGFDAPEQALQSLEHLRKSFNHRVSKQGHKRMEQLLPLLLKAVTKVTHPAVTLERITRLLEAVARRSVYLALLTERPVALAQLVKLCAASIWIAEHLARCPLLLDDLLNPASLYAPLDRTQLRDELNRDLTRVSVDDGEQTLDVLRHFKHSSILRVAAADVSGAMPLMIVSDHLTEIAETLLRKILDLAWNDLLARFGQPRSKQDGQLINPGFGIIAYGKLGGIELGYGSDLDLVFLHNSSGEQQYTDGPRQIDNASFFVKLAQRVIHMLTAHSAAGVLYEVDTRLRPSGHSGLLVSSVDAFLAYQRNQAWIWEHQALVRARPVAGSEAIAQRFNAIRRQILSQPRDLGELRREVREMRERMRQELGGGKAGFFHLKQDRGGIADIEFIVQYAVLKGAHQHPELLTYTDNIRQLDGLEQAEVLSFEDATLLRDAYRALRRRGHLLKLQDLSNLIPEKELEVYRQGVAHIWQALMEAP